jgi:uroporphyrinogen-III decarboxylase
VETLTYALIDTPAILDEWCELQMVTGTRAMELILAERPDYVLFGGSGTITLASPELVRRYALPALKKWSRMCRAAGVATVLHSCGKSRALVDLLAEEADVNCINPLEVAPMGDVDLAEVKRARGRQISLMGNLHTTDVMLRGTPDDVRRAARQALRDAGKRRRAHPVHRRPMWTGNARRQSLRARGNRAEIWRVRSRDRPTPR